MDIGNWLRRTGREGKVIQSTVWNTIIALYKQKTGRDVTPYLESISLSWDTILVKTKKPIINTELSYIQDEIQLSCSEKFAKLGIKLKNMKYKFY